MNASHCQAAIRASLLLVVVLSVFGACTKKDNKRQVPAVPVNVVKAETRDAERLLDAVGTVKASNSVTVKPQVEGRILRIHFLDGDKVEAGQLLYTIDPGTYSYSHSGALADVAKDRADAEMARKDFMRFKALMEQGVVSRDEYEQKQTAYQTARKAMESDMAQAGIAGKKVSYTRISSPIDGIAGSTILDEGNLVVADQSELVVIKTVAPADITFSIPGKYLSMVRSRAVDENLKVRAIPALGAANPVLGELTFVDNWINTATGMINLKARFANEDRNLWPGQFVTIQLILGVLDNVVHVPTQAVQKGPDGDFVYVVKDGKAVVTPVSVIMSSVDDVVVDKGLSPGDQIIVDGMFRLYPNAPVAVKKTLPASKPATPAAAKQADSSENDSANATAANATAAPEPADAPAPADAANATGAGEASTGGES